MNINKISDLLTVYENLRNLIIKVNEIVDWINEYQPIEIPAVMYVEQALDAAQKLQARINIDAASDSDVDDLQNAISEITDSIEQITSELDEVSEELSTALSNITNLQTTKLDKSGGTITGNLTVNGNIAFAGVQRTDIPMNTDLRTILDGGHYRCRQTATVSSLDDCPTNHAFIMDVYSTTGEATGSGTYKYLEYEITDNAGRHFRRSARSESTSVFTFSDWEEVVGVVSSGNTFRRLSDGTQVCWGLLTTDSIPAGSAYIDVTVPFPKEFVTTGTSTNIVCTYCGNTTNVNNVALCDTRASQTTATEWHPRIFRQAGAPTTSAITPAFFYIAIGRWK